MKNHEFGSRLEKVLSAQNLLDLFGWQESAASVFANAAAALVRTHRVMNGMSAEGMRQGAIRPVARSPDIPASRYEQFPSGR